MNADARTRAFNESGASLAEITTLPTARPDLVQELLDRLQRELSLHRQRHVMGVTHTVAMLAARHGLDVERATLAGLLHDLYKEWPEARLRSEIERFGGAVAAEDVACPAVWHGQCAALFARRELGLHDAEIDEAVALHTTADAGIMPLTRALFVADFAEPGRKTDSAPAVLAAACADLEDGFRQALLAKTRHMLGRGKRVSARALRAMQAYLSPVELDGLAGDKISDAKLHA